MHIHITANCAFFLSGVFLSFLEEEKSLCAQLLTVRILVLPIYRNDSQNFNIIFGENEIICEYWQEWSIFQTSWIEMKLLALPL